MPVKIVRRSNWELVGRGAILLSCPPALGQSGDLYTGKLVEEAALLSKAHAIIGKEAMNNLDSLAHQAALSEFDQDLRRIVEESGIALVLVILGTTEPGIEIKTEQSQTEFGETADLLRKSFEPEYFIKMSHGRVQERGDRSAELQTASLLLGPDTRGLRKDLTISRIVDLVGLLNGKMGQSDAE